MVNTEINNVSASELCNIYSTNRDLYIRYENPNNEQADLKIYNVTGNLIKSEVSLTNELYHTTLDVAPGCYIVKVVSNSNVYLKKVYIQ